MGDLDPANFPGNKWCLWDGHFRDIRPGAVPVNHLCLGLVFSYQGACGAGQILLACVVPLVVVRLVDVLSVRKVDVVRHDG